MTFISGLLAGFLMSIPPGPATAGLLEPALNGRRGSALSHLLNFLIADLLILSMVAVIWVTFGPFSQTFWLRMFGGLFLIALGIKFLITPPKNEHGSRSFWRTIFNPGAWFVALGIMSFSSSEGLVDTLWYLGGVQLGSILWFVGLIGVLAKVPLRQHRLVQNVSVASLFVIGGLVVLMSFR